MSADEGGAEAGDDRDPRSGNKQPGGEELPTLQSETSVIVLNETLVVSETWNGTPASVAVRWSLLRAAANAASLVTVTTSTDDANTAVVASDVRIELLGDDLYNRLTRGVEVVVHDYEVLAGPAELLRNSAGHALVEKIAGHAITWPLR